ncbi:CRISPR-associated endonuclease Cas1 [Roseateles sp. GG27B]
MGILILDRRNMALRLDGEAAAVYESDQRKGSVPLKLVSLIVVHGSGIALDAGVLGQVAEHGGVAVLLSGRHGRRVAYVVGPGHNDIAMRLAQARAVTDTVQIDAWAARLVLAKLRHQQRFLVRAQALRPDQRKPLFDAQRRLSQDIARLHAITAAPASSNPGAAVLRGIEGSAAAAYFKGYASLFAAGLSFNGRNRRPPRDPVNACLSLAYTLFNALAVQACQVAGLDPLMGLYHRPAHGRASLASDLIEPLRALADEWVWQLFRERALRDDHFWRDGDACLLGKAGREVFYRAFTPTRRTAERWLRAQCRGLAQQWRAAGIALLPDQGEAPDSDENYEPDESDEIGERDASQDGIPSGAITHAGSAKPNPNPESAA